MPPREEVGVHKSDLDQTQVELILHGFITTDLRTPPWKPFSEKLVYAYKEIAACALIQNHRTQLWSFF